MRSLFQVSTSLSLGGLLRRQEYRECRRPRVERFLLGPGPWRLLGDYCLHLWYGRRRLREATLLLQRVLRSSNRARLLEWILYSRGTLVRGRS